MCLYEWTLDVFPNKCSMFDGGIVMNMPRNVFVAVAFARSRTDFYFSRATIAATKKLRDTFVSGHVRLGNDSCNLCHNHIAKQAARKID